MGLLDKIKEIELEMSRTQKNKVGGKRVGVPTPRAAVLRELGQGMWGPNSGRVREARGGRGGLGERGEDDGGG